MIYPANPEDRRALEALLLSFYDRGRREIVDVDGERRVRPNVVSLALEPLIANLDIAIEPTAHSRRLRATPEGQLAIERLVAGLELHEARSRGLALYGTVPGNDYAAIVNDSPAVFDAQLRRVVALSEEELGAATTRLSKLENELIVRDEHLVYVRDVIAKERCAVQSRTVREGGAIVETLEVLAPSRRAYDAITQKLAEERVPAPQRVTGAIDYVINKGKARSFPAFTGLTDEEIALAIGQFSRRELDDLRNFSQREKVREETEARSRGTLVAEQELTPAMQLNGKPRDVDDRARGSNRTAQIADAQRDAARTSRVANEIRDERPGAHQAADKLRIQRFIDGPEYRYNQVEAQALLDSMQRRFDEATSQGLEPKTGRNLHIGYITDSQILLEDRLTHQCAIVPTELIASSIVGGSRARIKDGLPADKVLWDIRNLDRPVTLSLTTTENGHAFHFASESPSTVRDRKKADAQEASELRMARDARRTYDQLLIEDERLVGERSAEILAKAYGRFNVAVLGMDALHPSGGDAQYFEDANENDREDDGLGVAGDVEASDDEREGDGEGLEEDDNVRRQSDRSDEDVRASEVYYEGPVLAVGTYVFEQLVGDHRQVHPLLGQSFLPGEQIRVSYPAGSDMLENPAVERVGARVGEIAQAARSLSANVQHVSLEKSAERLAHVVIEGQYSEDVRRAATKGVKLISDVTLSRSHVELDGNVIAGVHGLTGFFSHKHGEIFGVPSDRFERVPEVGDAIRVRVDHSGISGRIVGEQHVADRTLDMVAQRVKERTAAAILADSIGHEVERFNDARLSQRAREGLQPLALALVTNEALYLVDQQRTGYLRLNRWRRDEPAPEVQAIKDSGWAIVERDGGVRAPTEAEREGRVDLRDEQQKLLDVTGLRLTRSDPSLLRAEKERVLEVSLQTQDKIFLVDRNEKRYVAMERASFDGADILRSGFAVVRGESMAAPTPAEVERLGARPTVELEPLGPVGHRSVVFDSMRPAYTEGANHDVVLAKQTITGMTRVVDGGLGIVRDYGDGLVEITSIRESELQGRMEGIEDGAFSRVTLAPEGLAGIEPAPPTPGTSLRADVQAVIEGIQEDVLRRGQTFEREREEALDLDGYNRDAGRGR